MGIPINSDQLVITRKLLRQDLDSRTTPVGGTEDNDGAHRRLGHTVSVVWRWR